MMRLRLKNTFVEVDLATVADTTAGGSSPCLLELAGHGRSPTAMRSRSLDVESPSRMLREVRTCPQLDRLNNILFPCQPHGFSWHADGLKDRRVHKGTHASCASVADSEEAVVSSACSTESPGSAGSGRKHRVWSYDFSSTAPSDPGDKEYAHKDVPRRLDFEAASWEASCSSSASSRQTTTLMIRNIPNRYTQQDLLEELVGLGFAGQMDFLYMPRDKAAKASIGYAFVNFLDGATAQRCVERLSGHSFARRGKCRDALVSAAHLQGLEANLAHYERSVVGNARIARHRPLVLCADPLHSCEA